MVLKGSDAMQGIIENIATSYDKIAASYTEGSKPFNETCMHPAIIALAEKWGGNFNNATVLDIGCGPGGLMLKLKELGATVFGMDVSEKLLDIAASRGLTNLVRGSMHQVADFYRQGMFDFVVSNYALHYLPKEGQAATLRGVFNVLKRDGILVYSLNHPYFLRGSYFNGDEPTPARTKDYFSPCRTDVWGIEEFGEPLPMFRLDWPEIYTMNRRVGFDVLELVDGVLPRNIDEIIAKTPNAAAAALIKGFKINPFAVFVVSLKVC
jgi:SAM-dependent methyltransferase